jgi:undecaprenyl-diphosphatase
MTLLAKAFVMGLVEGLTEFLPVSSTGHLILTGAFLNYPSAQRVTMEIFIQMGAILAVFWHYRVELIDVGCRVFRDASARALVLKIVLAFLPAAVVGLLLHHAIEQALFTPRSVAAALILGGVIILLVDRSRQRAAVERIEATGWGAAFWVGVAQIASLAPGVSRAGATIVGGLLVGLSRSAATQFSLYLALPTVSAASLFSLFDALPLLGKGDVAPLVVGFVTAFAAALVVIRSFLVYIRSHDLRVFGHYRIALGAVVYLLLRRPQAW